MSSPVWRHRALVAELAKREFSGRYRGSFGGLAWSFAQPLFLLAVYTVAFGVILRARWGFSGGTGDYALMVFAGLIVFNAFAECLTRAPTLVTGNPNFVKRVVFPLEVLPWVMGFTAFFHAFIGIAVEQKSGGAQFDARVGSWRESHARQRACRQPVRMQALAFEQGIDFGPAEVHDAAPVDRAARVAYERWRRRH
jgi:hypothetical protein